MMQETVDRTSQPILAPPPPHARIVVLEFTSPVFDPSESLIALYDRVDPMRTVVGLGAPVLQALGKSVEGLHAFPALAGPGIAVPSTQGALCFVLHGDDRGELLHRSRKIVRALAPVFAPSEIIDAFTHREGRDLSGYEDGTENPKGDAATQAAIARGLGAGLDGGSFLSIQRWAHDLDSFEKRSRHDRDQIIGRGIEDNAEISDAAASAHVKRAAQESFEPPAFMVRRSMPYATPTEHGLCFMAYGASLQPFEQVLRRMVGLDDGIVDALFHFTKPKSGGHYFCPPLWDGVLDLTVLGL